MTDSHLPRRASSNVVNVIEGWKSTSSYGSRQLWVQSLPVYEQECQAHHGCKCSSCKNTKKFWGLLVFSIKPMSGLLGSRRFHVLRVPLSDTSNIHWNLLSSSVILGNKEQPCEGMWVFIDVQMCPLP